MAAQKFSKKEAIKFGWRVTKSNLWFFVGVLIVAGLVIIVPDAISSFISRPPQNNSFVLLTSLIIAIFVFIMQRIFEMGFLKISLMLHDDQKVKMSDLFSCFPLFFKYVGGMILYLLIVVGGLVLLVIPGIIWSIRFGFYACLIVDKGLGPVEALKKSYQITKGSAWNIFLLDILNAGIILLGILCLVIGLFAAIPVTLLAWVYVYRRLLSKPEAVNSVQI